MQDVSHIYYLFVALVIYLTFVAVRALKKIGSIQRTRFWLATPYFLLGWLFVISALGITGFFRNFATVPPRIGVAVVPALLALLFLAFSKRGGELAQAFSIGKLTMVQSFR